MFTLHEQPSVLAAFKACDTPFKGAHRRCSGSINLARTDINVSFALVPPCVPTERLPRVVVFHQAGVGGVFDGTREFIHHLDLATQPLCLADNPVPSHNGRQMHLRSCVSVPAAARSIRVEAASVTLR